MSIRFVCECGKKLKASDDKIGKRVLCPDCGQPVTVPSSSRSTVEAIDAPGPGEDPLKDSAQTARELLKLSATASKEGQETRQAEREQTRQKGEEAGVTFSEMAQYYGWKVGLPAVGVVMGCVLLYMFMSWMMADTPNYPDLYPVSGVVMLDGEPLEGAVVTFRWQEALLSEERVAASIGRTDDEGRYSLEYVPDVPGAVLGRHYVEINKIGPDGREVLPAEYHSRTVLEAEVTADKKTGYDFSLQSKPTGGRSNGGRR